MSMADLSPSESKIGTLRALLLALLEEHERDGALPTSARFLYYELVQRGQQSKERTGDGGGLPVFDRLRYRRDDRRVFLYAFDLIELDGDDLRREPIERRKAVLAKLLGHAKAGLLLNEHINEPGDVVFRHACKMGLEGIVSKRLGSTYRSGRSQHWVKSKNPAAPAVKREAEEDWS
jgi:hypothetical protein